MNRIVIRMRAKGGGGAGRERPQSAISRYFPPVLEVVECEAMMKIVAVLVMATCAAQAGLVVLPNSNAAANGNSGTVIPFAEGTQDVLFQWDIAGSQFGSVPVGSSITALGFRLAGTQSTLPSAPLTIGTFDLQLSTSLNPIGALSATEANNIGPDAVTVLSGPLVIPTNACSAVLDQIHSF